MRQLLAAVFASTLSCSAVAAPDVFTLPADIDGQTILYVGAHPDDEWGITPILAEACIDRSAKCRFVVLSEALSYGCLPTIGLRDPEECSKRRRAEMQEAAAMFGGSVEFFGLEDLFYSFNEDGKNRVLRDWSAAAGGRTALVSRLVNVLQRERPRLVFTFDPRHGSSCHSGHRAAAVLVVEAVGLLPAADRPEVWLEQTTDIAERAPEAKDIIEAGGYVGWPDTMAETKWYDATRLLRSGMTGYDYVVAGRKIHASQVPDEVSGEKVLNPPMESRRVPLSLLSADVDTDYCSKLNLDRPTLDIPENRKRFGIDP